MAQAAAMLPPLCHDGDAIAIVPCFIACVILLALLAAAGQLLFLNFLIPATPSLAVWHVLLQCDHHCTMMLLPLPSMYWLVGAVAAD